MPWILALAAAFGIAAAILVFARRNRFYSAYADNSAASLPASRLRDIIAKFDIQDLDYLVADPAVTAAQKRISALRTKLDPPGLGAMTPAVTDTSSNVQQPPQPVSWRDVQKAELCLVAVLPDESVSSELITWRERMRQILGVDWYERLSEIYRPAGPDSESRRQLRQVIGIAYEFYQTHESAALLRRSMATASLFVLLAMLAIAASLATALSLAGPDALTNLHLAQSNLFLLLATSVTGAIGSFVSLQLRLQKSAPGDPFDRLPQLAQEGPISIVSPIVIGAIFGFLIYLLVASNLALGSLVHWDKTGQLESSSGPLLLILGFVAGFAEQLIPDAVTQIASRVARSMKSSGGDEIQK